MSQAAEIFAQDGGPLLLEQGGQEVTYLVPGEPQLALTALVGAVRIEDAGEGIYGRTRRLTRELVLSRNSGGEFGGHVSPAENHEVIIDSETWSVSEVAQRSDGLCQLKLVRTGGVERSRPGYRKTE